MTELNAKAHLTDDAMELYALGRLPERELAAFEEHLLICASCQDRLDEQDNFVHTMREALTRVATERTPERQPFWALTAWRKPAMAFAMAAALLAVVVIPRYTGPGAPQAVELSAIRGESGQAQAQPGQPLELRLATGTAATIENARVQIVDLAGREIWSGAANLATDKHTVTVKDGLESGRYWVRIYSGTDLLNEYALAIE